MTPPPAKSFSRHLRRETDSFKEMRETKIRVLYELHIKDHDNGRVKHKDQNETRTMSCPQPSGGGLGHEPVRNVPSYSVHEKGGRNTNSKLNQSHETTEEFIWRAMSCLRIQTALSAL